MTKTRAEYEEWKKKHGVELKACSGFSSRIYVSEEVVVKEQILSLHHGEWVSLQLYRDDVPGMAETREKILREDEEIEISKKGMESIIFFRTHKWMEEEVEPMQRAADAKLTPPLMDHFYVTLAHPKFRLGLPFRTASTLSAASGKTEKGVCGNGEIRRGKIPANRGKSRGGGIGVSRLEPRQPRADIHRQAAAPRLGMHHQRARSTLAKKPTAHRRKGNSVRAAMEKSRHAQIPVQNMGSVSRRQCFLQVYLPAILSGG